MDKTQIQIYITTDDSGEITSAQIGENIIPVEPCDFFFLVDEEEGVAFAADVTKYKVEIVGMKPSLVLRDDLPAE